MKFCPTCRNMLYAFTEDVVGDKKVAVHMCRSCSYKEPVTRENPVVYERNLRQENTASLAMNPYLKHDPTLEHLTNIICPNEECETNTDGEDRDVVPVEIDSKKLVWMYQCAICNTTWTQSSGAGRNIVSK